MNKLMVFGVTALFILFASGLSPAAEVSSVEMIDFGIYQPAIISKQKAPGTMDGQVSLVEADKLVLEKQTEKIPAILGTEFGFRYKLVGSPDGDQVPVTMKVVTPGLNPPGTGKTEYMSTVNWTRKIGELCYAGFGFEQQWEAVPGAWKIQIFFQDRKLAEKTFTVFQP